MALSDTRIATYPLTDDVPASTRLFGQISKNICIDNLEIQETITPIFDKFCLSGSTDNIHRSIWQDINNCLSTGSMLW
jgi:hypothetical protein